MKYGIWNIAEPKMEAVNQLTSGGYAPLTAMILASRGMEKASQADSYLDCNASLADPFEMRDMDKAANRLRLALARGEKIAVFGDYDVDGITATCLLADFIRSRGGNCVPYIPGRLEEGYGLNPIALHHLRQEGVQLIVTVDCGITAISEAQLCKRLGMDLVITDITSAKMLCRRQWRWWTRIVRTVPIPTMNYPVWVLPLSWPAHCAVARKRFWMLMRIWCAWELWRT